MYLVTGSAGFIGRAVCERLLSAGHEVIGLDNLNDYYDVELKKDRLETLFGSRGQAAGRSEQAVGHAGQAVGYGEQAATTDSSTPNSTEALSSHFTFYEGDISDQNFLSEIFLSHDITHIIHLAAQAGVRYSLTNPEVYVQSNLVGFANILEQARHAAVKHLVFASTSSVYGDGVAPYSEEHAVDHQISFYSATKKANEAMAHSYAAMYNLPATALRFFTVYGPWGRPDMALFKFAKKIIAGEPIDVYNHGKMLRDFTYIDDITNAICRIVDKPAVPEPNWQGHRTLGNSFAPYTVYNIGRGEPVELMEYIAALESALGKKAQINFMPLQNGDVLHTHADTSKLAADFDYHPAVSVTDGVQRFVDWYLAYHHPELDQSVCLDSKIGVN